MNEANQAIHRHSIFRVSEDGVVAGGAERGRLEARVNWIHICSTFAHYEHLSL